MTKRSKPMREYKWFQDALNASCEEWESLTDAERAKIILDFLRKKAKENGNQTGGTSAGDS